MTAHSLELTRAGLVAALWQAATSAKASATAPHDDGTRRRLAAALDIYDNDDAVARRMALAASAAGRPAFWTAAGYHSQKACALQLAVHTQPTIEAALDHAYSPGGTTEARLAALATLVPLNRPAVEALALAYARLGGWRPIDELEARCLRDMRPQEREARPSVTHLIGDSFAGLLLDEMEHSALISSVNGESAARQTRGKT